MAEFQPITIFLFLTLKSFFRLFFRQMLQKMILMQEYKEKMEQLRTQIEEAYADDEEIIEFIKKRNERIAKEKAREKALAKIREAESEEKTKK